MRRTTLKLKGVEATASLFSRHVKKGQSATEFAVVLTVFLLLLLGGIDFGRLFYFSVEVNHAARAGVQYGARSHVTAVDNTGMQLAATQDATNITGSWWGTTSHFASVASHFCQCKDGTTSNCTAGACGSNAQFTFVQVTTSADFKPVTPFVGLPSLLTLHGKAIMRVGS